MGMGDTYREAARALQDRFDTRRLADRLHDMFRARVDARRRAAVHRVALDVLPRHGRRRRAAAVLVQGRGAGVRARAGADGAVLPELRRQRDVPVDGQPGREPGRRDAVHRLRRAGAGAGVGPGDDHATSPALVGDATRAPSSSCASPSTRCSRTARATSTAWTSREQSVFVPAADGSAPVPDWKRAPWACDVLRRRRSRPCLSISRAGRSSPSARRSSSAPARRTRRRRDSRRRRRRQHDLDAELDDASDDDGADHDDHDDHAAARPTRSPLGVCAGDPDAHVGRAVDPARRRPRPTRSTSTWEVAADERFADVTATGTVTATRRRRPQRARRRRARRAVVVPLPRRRVHQPGRPGRPDRRQPSTLRLAAASCQHWETGFYAAHRDIAEWAPDLVVFLGDFIYEGAAAPGRRRSGPGPRRSRADRPRRLPGALRPVPVRPAAAGVAGRLPVGADLGRPRGGEQLRRRSTPQDPAEQATFAARRAAAYRAWWEHMPVRLPAAGRRRRTTPSPDRWRSAASSTSILLDGRQFRSDQACGDATLSDRPAVPGGARPGADDARRRPGAVGGRRLRRLVGDVDRARPADRAHRPAPAQRGDPQPRPVGRLRAGAGPPARRGRRRRPARRAHRRHPPRRRRPASPASAPSS